jgi:hypothetical protein
MKNGELLRGESLLLNQKYQEIKHGAKVRSIPFLLTHEEHTKLILDACFYCGKLSGIGDEEGNTYFNGVDRVDNEKGYIIGNCIACCFICNRMKHVLPVKDFIEHIAKIYKQQQGLIEAIEKGFIFR